jgi:hypothetical protein
LFLLTDSFKKVPVFLETGILAGFSLQAETTKRKEIKEIKW